MSEDKSAGNGGGSRMSRSQLLNAVLVTVLAGTALYACSANGQLAEVRAIAERAEAAANRANKSGEALTDWAYSWTYVQNDTNQKYLPRSKSRNGWAKHIDIVAHQGKPIDHDPPPPPPPRW